MTAILTIIVLVLITIAIWQMVKIFDLSQMNADRSQVANDKDNNINGYLMIMFVIFIHVLTVVSFWKWSDVLLPESASEHGVLTDKLLAISFAVIFFVQTITQILLHYFAFKYRGEKGKKALFYADNNKLEIIWTVIPVIVLAGLIISGLFAWNDITSITKTDDDLEIELYAQQFGWQARYAGQDNVLGDANVRLINIDKANALGVDVNDPNAQDDIIVQEIHLPVGKKAIFKMRSQDVLHSAYMPHFRQQMNCVPGQVTEFAFVPTITTKEMRENETIVNKVNKINEIRLANNEKIAKENRGLPKEEQMPRLEPYEFDYLLLCNKICGKSHYNMQLKIIVETQEEYENWIKQQKTFKESVAVNYEIN
ncbi:MAG: cytochrome c oxidase subunit II [Flavobacteriaceae bacterium]|nr:cytochrome c oxidase subunit II [Flavobacteriaceae bacterium]